MKLLHTISREMNEQCEKHFGRCSSLLNAAEGLDPRNKERVDYEDFSNTVPFPTEDFSCDYKLYSECCSGFEPKDPLNF